MKYFGLGYLLCIGMSSAPCFAYTLQLDDKAQAVGDKTSSWFAPTRGEDGPRSVYWRPLVSFLLPGFDQYMAGHLSSGLAYSSLWFGANLWAGARLEKLDEQKDAIQWSSLSRKQQQDYRDHEELPRQVSLSSQYITAVGAMSAWHSFRTSVETQKAEGHYTFLKLEETPLDLLAAPFHFAYLERSTTWIPLLVAATFGALGGQGLPDEYQRDPYNTADAAYAGAFSYNAGVSEEALFRGYLQPVLYENWGSSEWSNLGQAVVFGVAHLGTIDKPLPQIGMGYYLGWLHQKRDWTLGEGIFVHAWWDVIALSASYMVRLKDKERAKPAVIWLPPLTFSL